MKKGMKQIKIRYLRMLSKVKDQVFVNGVI